MYFLKEDFIKNQQNTTQNYNHLHNLHNPPPHRIQTRYNEALQKQINHIV